MAWPPVRRLFAGFVAVARSAGGPPVVEAFRAHVADRGDAEAPAERDDPVGANVAAEEQPAHGVVDRCERLVLREPGQPDWEGVGVDEPAAEEGRQGQASRSNDDLGVEAERDREPGQGEREQGGQPERFEPLEHGGGPSEADRDRDLDEDLQASETLQQSGQDVGGEHRWAPDGHGLGAMMPSVTSVETAMTVPCAPPTTVSSAIVGAT